MTLFGPISADFRQCESLAAVIKEHGAQVKCENALPTILGHPPQIGQLLQNLIGNGIKYNRSQAPEIRITSTETDDHWSVEISDNGIGIETQFLQRIFQPFKRLHGESEFEGTGLGLATCKKIAERHNGTLSCQSEPGSGSTFTLVVPKASLQKANAA